MDSLFWPNLSFEIFHAVKLSQWNKAPRGFVGGAPNLNNFFEILIYFSEPIDVDDIFWPNLSFKNMLHAVKLSQWDEAPTELVGGSPNLDQILKILKS